MTGSIVEDRPGSLSGIQLDLKYQMPRKGYLAQWVKRLPGWGINTLLIEYEDKFPFRKYPFLRSPDAFTPDELRYFLATSRDAGLTVIPLIQSLSHLEFALNHPELAYLAEAPDIPTQVCPSKPAALEFIKDLYAEVFEFHSGDAYFHCGGDETWFMGTCSACKPRLQQSGPIAFWAGHLRPILDFVIRAGKRPIVWDDIFWKDFEAIKTVGLPKETILHAWNYGIRTLVVKNQKEVDSEFGGPGGVLKQIETYRQAGYQAIAAPCCNYGQLFPRFAPSLDNARVWATKVRHAGMLGTINTAWACFHVPLPSMDPLVAATGELCANPDAGVGTGWVRQWVAQEYGADVAGIAEAFETMGEVWEVSLPPEYGRPFTPIVYGYMSMVIHYPGRQEERRKRGAYPNNWETIDFCALYRTGIAEMRKGDLVPVLQRLDRILADYPPAVETFRRLARDAGRRRDQAGMLALFAEMKLTSARVLDFALRGRGSRDLLREELAGQKPRLEAVLAQLYESEGAHRMMRVWWEPAYDFLRQA